MQFIESEPKIEYRDRFDLPQKSWGCSCVGVTEFERLLKRLEFTFGQRSEQHPELSWTQLYQRDAELRKLVDRGLVLNGVNPDDCTPALIWSFLFYRWDEDRGEYRQGWLVEINGLEDEPGEVMEGLGAGELAEAMAVSGQRLQEVLGLVQEPR